MDVLLNPREVPFGEAGTAAEQPARVAVLKRLTFRGKLLIALAVLLAVIAATLGGTRLAIRHDKLPLFDMARSRSVPVDLYVRRDKAMAALAGMAQLPVALVSHGNTVASGEYSFICDTLAARGYLVASIQHDLPTDPPLAMKGYPYVGRLPAYERGAANIDFVIGELKKSWPNADYNKLLLIGHSNGGDISVFYAAAHPDTVSRVVTLDNLRVPLEFVRAKLLSFRSNGAQFKPDQGVVPSEADRAKEGVDVEMTGAPHEDLSDRGPDSLKNRIADKLSKFLDDDRPAPKRPPVTAEYAPGAPY
jgi:hypothetical protein